MQKICKKKSNIFNKSKKIVSLHRILNKLIMSKKIFFSVSLVLTSVALQAQDFGIASTGQKLMNELAKAFPYIALAGLAGVGIYNIGNFVGENADTSKGIKNVIKYLVFLLIVVAIYQFAKSQIKL